MLVMSGLLISAHVLHESYEDAGSGSCDFKRGSKHVWLLPMIVFVVLL